jgi:hypothetical protein
MNTKSILSFFNSHKDDIHSAIDAAEHVYGAGTGPQKAELAVDLVAAEATQIRPDLAPEALLFRFLGDWVIEKVANHKNATGTMPVVTTPIVITDGSTTPTPATAPAQITPITNGTTTPSTVAAALSVTPQTSASAQA